MFSYGFAVPLISAYLMWLKAGELREAPKKPDYWLAVPVAFVGVLSLAIGTVGALRGLQGVSLVITLAGLVLLLYGSKVLRIIAFPLAYLLLMVPVWTYPLERLQLPSQLLSAQIAARLLDLVGLPAFEQGTLLVVPGMTLEVMRECSGVNQLVALLAMVIPAGYLWLRSWSRRVALLLLAVVVAYASNGLRIAVIGFMASKGWRDGSLTGPAHVLEGLAISIVGYLVIGVCLSLLADTERSRDVEHVTEQPSALPAFSARPLVETVLVVVMLATAASSILATRFEVALPNELAALPGRIGDWTLDEWSPFPRSRFPGIDEAFVRAYPTPAGERRFQGIDNEIVREYSNPSGDRIRLYIGYYRRQNEGKEIAGDASHALQLAATDLSVALSTETVQLKEIVRKEGRRERGLLYWYDVNGRVISNRYLAKGYTIWDAFTRARTNGAVVMIAWEASAGPTSVQARQSAIAFASELLPQLRPLLPS
jgi:EpsI family protein